MIYEKVYFWYLLKLQTFLLGGLATHGELPTVVGVWK